MTMQFVSPNCGRQPALPDLQSGKQTQCLYCSEMIDVPDANVAQADEPLTPVRWDRVFRLIGFAVRWTFVSLAIVAACLYFGWP
jgi:hypothetical protein